MKRSALLTACALLMTATTGCSTITQSKDQRVSVVASHEGKALKDVDCSLSNDKGRWFVRSPGQVMIRKSNENLGVICQKEGLVDGLLIAVSRAAGSMWGNIIFGGVVGALVDHNYGPGYDYPDSLQVEMGKSITLDKKKDSESFTNTPASCSPGQTC